MAEIAQNRVQGREQWKIFQGGTSKAQRTWDTRRKKILIIEPLQRVFRTILNDFFLLFLSFSLPTQYSFFCKQQSPPQPYYLASPLVRKFLFFKPL